MSTNSILKAVAKQRNNNAKKLGGVTGKGFLPGKSGNPKGRAPAGWTWAELIREYGDKDCPPKYAKALGLKENPKWKDVVVAMAFRHAAEGNASILKTLFEYNAPVVATNNETVQSVIILPAINEEKYDDSGAALREIYLNKGNGEDFEDR
jgi:hypothetical protein